MLFERSVREEEDRERGKSGSVSESILIVRQERSSEYELRTGLSVEGVS